MATNSDARGTDATVLLAKPAVVPATRPGPTIVRDPFRGKLSLSFHVPRP